MNMDELESALPADEDSTFGGAGEEGMEDDTFDLGMKKKKKKKGDLLNELLKEEEENNENGKFKEILNIFKNWLYLAFNYSLNMPFR